MDPRLSSIIKQTENWYGTTMIPNFGTRSLVQFASQSTRMVEYVAGRSCSFQIRANTSAAFIERKNKHDLPKIVIPTAYFTRSYYEDYFPGLANLSDEDFTRVAIAVFNGSMVHESQHARLTLPTLEAIVAEANIGPEYSRFKQFIYAIANVLEDIYIDADAMSKPYGGFVQAKNEIFFPAELVAKRVADFEEASAALAAHEPHHSGGKKLGADAIGEFVNLFITLKRAANLEHPIWEQEKFAPIAAMVKEIPGSENRYDILRRLVEYIFDVALPEAAEQAQQAGGDGSEDGSPINSAESPMFNPGTIDRLMSNGQNETGEQASKTTIEAAAEVGEGETNEVFINATGEREQSSQFSTMQIVTLELPRYSRGNVEPDPSFRRLGAVLRKMKARNTVPGRPMKSGNTLVGTRLYRIGSDGEVFTNMRKERADNETETVFLVDASGSMGLLYTRVVRAAYGAFVSLRQAGAAVAVYAHTGHPNDYGIPAVYPVAGHKIGPHTASADDAFARMLHINLNENYDGFAIEEMRGVFTRRSGRKLLVVLSDGQPSGRLYNGPSAFNHTKDAIRKLRRSGIDVIAISLVSSVKRMNDEIYGREYNIDGTKDLEAQFKKLIAKIEAV